MPGPGVPQSHGGGGADGGAGGEFDFASAFKSTKAELEKTKGGMQKLSQDFDMLRKTKSSDDQRWQKLQEVFSPQEPKEADPVSEFEAEMDQVINAAIESERAGRPIPMTARAHIAALQARIEQAKFQKEMLSQIQELKAATQRANDPQAAINNSAYATMDNFVQNSLDQIYGDGQNYIPVKRAQFDAVTKRMSGVIHELKTKAPEKWDRIRRSKELMQGFVQHHVKEILPPKAVQLLEQDHLSKTEMTTDELWRAFQEAGAIQNPEERKSVRERIRQDIVGRMGPAARRRPG